MPITPDDPYPENQGPAPAHSRRGARISDPSGKTANNGDNVSLAAAVDSDEIDGREDEREDDEDEGDNADISSSETASFVQDYPIAALAGAFISGLVFARLLF